MKTIKSLTIKPLLRHPLHGLINYREFLFNIKLRLLKLSSS